MLSDRNRLVQHQFFQPINIKWTYSTYLYNTVKGVPVPSVHFVTRVRQSVRWGPFIIHEIRACSKSYDLWFYWFSMAMVVRNCHQISRFWFSRLFISWLPILNYNNCRIFCWQSVVNIKLCWRYISTHTRRKEWFWLFKKTQRKISKNTLRRVNLLGLKERWLHIPQEIAFIMVPCKSRFNTSKGQFIWLSRSSKESTATLAYLDRTSGRFLHAQEPPLWQCQLRMWECPGTISYWKGSWAVVNWKRPPFLDSNAFRSGFVSSLEGFRFGSSALSVWTFSYPVCRGPLVMDTMG